MDVAVAVIDVPGVDTAVGGMSVAGMSVGGTSVGGTSVGGTSVGGTSVGGIGVKPEIPAVTDLPADTGAICQAMTTITNITIPIPITLVAIRLGVIVHLLRFLD